MVNRETWEKRRWNAILCILNGTAASGRTITANHIENVVRQADTLVDYLKQEEEED